MSVGDSEIKVEVASEEDFHDALRTLLQTAVANDVEVRGGWPVLPEDEPGGWDLQITRVRRR